MKEVTKQNVKEGEYFKLKGDTDTRYAYQVMELWDNVMVVNCNGGCMEKYYSEWERVPDISKCTNVVKATYFEDNRNAY